MSNYAPQKGAFDDMFRDEHMYHLIARGAPADLAELDSMIVSGKASIEETVNRPDRFGHTPLYIASQNGNLEVVKFLLGHKADPLMKSRFSGNEEEGNLSVAARWKHERVVEHLLENCDWTAKDLSRAKTEAGTTRIRRMVGRKLAQVKGSACCFCCIPDKKNKKDTKSG